jgi:hypothetical protein
MGSGTVAKDIFLRIWLAFWMAFALVEMAFVSLDKKQ